MTDCHSTHDSLFPQYFCPNFFTLGHVVLPLCRHALLVLLLQCSLFVLLCHAVSPYYLHMKKGGYCNYPSLVSAHLSQLNSDLASPVL